jgi:hypothetical protein
MVRRWVHLRTSVTHADKQMGLHLKFSSFAFVRFSQIKTTQNCNINSPNIKFR